MEFIQSAFSIFGPDFESVWAEKDTSVHFQSFQNNMTQSVFEEEYSNKPKESSSVNYERQFMDDPEEYLIARQMRDKGKWKSKAEEVEYENC